PAPADEIEAGPRLHVERALGILYPFEVAGHHARGGQRDEVARHDHAGAAEGTAGARWRGALEDRHAVAAPRGVERRRKADDAAADDDDPLRLRRGHAGRIP